MRMLIVTLSAALMLLSIVPQAGAAKSHLKCGGDNLQCGNLAKVCNPKNGKCCCLSYGTYQFSRSHRRIYARSSSAN